MKKNKPLISVIAILFIFSCKNEVDLKSVEEEVMQVEKNFSAMSANEGYKKAFASFGADDMVVLSRGGEPHIGKDDYLTPDNKAQLDFVLTWTPLHASAAKSGDMVSVFGEWLIKTKLESGKDTSMFGNYLTVWRKNKSGEWKFIMDGGTVTPGPTDPALVEKLKMLAEKNR
ncbi:hypothetical protein [Pollutibacter soli]|uniref:YybH family protein n=1 Tax=Pollutibacter soli TaxID=3034157 RepID=UPI003013A21D